MPILPELGRERSHVLRRGTSLRLVLKSIPALLGASLILGSCGDSSTGYITMSVKNEIAGFSFEYRSYYKDIDGPSIEDSRTHRFTDIGIFAPKKHESGFNPEPGKGGTVDWEYVPAAITVGASDSAKHPDRPAAVRIEDLLRSESTWPHYKLLERTTLIVAGVEAELVSFEVDGFFGPPPMLFTAQVSFDSNGIQYDIFVDAELGMAETVRADLDHLLETFKILE